MKSYMIGLGTIINSTAIVAGGLIGHFTGKLFRQDQQDAVNKACGISVLFIAIAGAMQGMLHIDNGKILSGKSMLVVLCLALGTIIGEIIGIERGFECFGEWLKVKSGNSGDKQFVNAFVTASLTVCIGAMAIVGAIQDGISGDYSTLAVKAVLDFIIVAVMTSSLGKGCIFSAIPVFLFEGAITVLAEASEVRCFDLDEVWNEISTERSRFCVLNGGLKVLREYLIVGSGHKEIER